MKDFLLEIMVTIVGVGAASGLYYQNGSVYLISDNSNHLYAYTLDTETLDYTLLVAGDSLKEQLPKRQKRDFEAVVKDDGLLFVYGSGSSSDGKRDLRATISIENRQTDTLENLSALYSRLREKFDIAADDFNIEGVVHHGRTRYLFNRGNGPGLKNGIFWLDEMARDTTFIPIPLPDLNGVPTGFTDAVVVDDTLYFLAAAEDSGSVYHDGAVLGTLLGKLTLPDLKLIDHTVISRSHKFEGITCYQQNDREIIFLLCEDPDDGAQVSTLYRLTVPR